MGKTTLVRTLVGLLECRHGQITFDGKDMTRFPPHERVRLGIGYVPQGREIFPHLTVEENLKIGLRKSKRATDGSVERMYTLFPTLKERRKQMGGTLSGGEQQMLAVARALMGEPGLLLLDEPTEGLQPLFVQLVEDVVRSVNRENGTTVLLTEQNLGIVFKLASRCYIVEKGRIVKELQPAQLADEELIKTYFVV
jgi:branched-chain amino acid transport system ATP-binding protein